MSISMYRAYRSDVPARTADLRTYLDKAEAYARERRSLSRHLGQRASGARICCRFPASISAPATAPNLRIARLTATDAPKFEDNEATIADLRERLAKSRGLPRHGLLDA